MWRDALVARLQHLEHPAWGPPHNRRVYGLSRQIVERDGIRVDDDVLFAAAWLHDIGTFGEFACEGADPPACAALACEELLPEVGFPAEKTERVIEIVRQHSFEGPTRESAEARVLRDADMLEFLGSVGLMRLLSLVELEEWVPEPRAAIALAMQFADDIPGKLLHDAARELAKPRIAETRAFVESLGAETAELQLV